LTNFWPIPRPVRGLKKDSAQSRTVVVYKELRVRMLKMWSVAAGLFGATGRYLSAICNSGEISSVQVPATSLTKFTGPLGTTLS
jgi:hypothetical protein